MNNAPIEPAGWKRPRGYVNAVAVPSAASLVFVAGQIAWDAEQRLVGPGDFAEQFRQALANVLTCVRAAGGEPDDVVRMTIYVTDKQRYLAAQRDIGRIWRNAMGNNYPAMSLVQVAALLEDGALVEIEATAAIRQDARR
jgi:enamine deaminase RidA (YjgF/YER057c/UK114 family)